MTTFSFVIPGLSRNPVDYCVAGGDTLLLWNQKIIFTLELAPRRVAPASTMRQAVS